MATGNRINMHSSVVC